MDVHNKETRSRNMKSIKGRDTKPELLIRKLLHRHGYRYRIAPSYLLGKPDIWLAKWNTAIFINGCFWHMHGCKAFKPPKSRREFWTEKLSKNKARDVETINKLCSKGIRVLTIWECTLKGADRIPDELLVTLIKTFFVTEYYRASIDTTGLVIE